MMLKATEKTEAGKGMDGRCFNFSWDGQESRH